MLTFTDEHTCEVTVYFLVKKSNAFKAYKMFEAWVSIHWNVKIKILRTDRGGEYMSKAFKRHLEMNGTTHDLTVHHSPAQNGILEHLNKTLVLRRRMCLIETGLPGYLWVEALQYAVWTKNQMLTHTLKNKTLHEMATGIKCHGSTCDACLQGWPRVTRSSKARMKNIGRKECRESQRKHVDWSDGSGREY